VFPSYAELHCLTNFTFLRGASHPEELVERAARLGYSALAITDECSLAGMVRAHMAAKEHGIKLIVGTEVILREERGGRREVSASPGEASRARVGESRGAGDASLPPPSSLQLVLLATDREGYGNLSELITRGRRRSKKGEYHLTMEDLDGGLPGCLPLLLPGEEPDIDHARWLRARFEGRCWIAVELLLGPDDRARLERLEGYARDAGLPLVAAGGVHMHVRARRALQNTLTAIRLGKPIARCGHALFPNAERYLRSRERLARLYPPELLIATLDVAECCTFSLDSLRYEYPEEIVPAGETPASWLRKLTEGGFRWRFGAKLSSASCLSPLASPPQAAAGWGGHFTAGRALDVDRARALVEHELKLIAELQYEPYFLTVYDVVKFARSQGILCQGRGSAANSAVCYCLGITEVDPARMDTLFERFISRERNEPPDIDVDFEHERREEVIQYIYRKYGRERAALAATVITYRPKSALRDVGKALGLDLAQVDRLAKSMAWWDGRKVRPERLREAGFDPDTPVIQKLIVLVGLIVGFPRHLSQHVGGFVISRGPLSRLVPIENAAMPDRTVIQWDKDDLDALGLLKVDVLALGMLTAIRRALELVSAWRGRPLTMSDVPPEDPGVYEMIGHADTIGVFQIESRAQQAMLPRMQPTCFYDLVIEVAIVRPGPIQGGMVHPYLRRRQGLEPVNYPSEDIKKVLERTLGVPIFQEQVMQLAVVAAGFTPGEADKLRRAMAAWRRKGGLEPFEKRLKDGMRERGYSEQFAEQIYRQILGFGEYGFPESHSASFALLVYVSCWLKRYEPAAFTCALLNSQPMGFYAPSQLVQDAQRHGVQVLPPDVLVSEWDCTLEPLGSGVQARGERREARGDALRVAPSPQPAPRDSSPASIAMSRATRASSVASPPSGAAVEAEQGPHRLRWGCDPRPDARGRPWPPLRSDSRPQGSGPLFRALAAPAPRSGAPSPAREEGVSLREACSKSPSPLTGEGRGEGEARSAPLASPTPSGAGWGEGGPAIRLGLRMVKGLSKDAADRLIEARQRFASRLPPLASRFTFDDLAHAAALNRHDVNALASAGALASIAGHRRQAAWVVTGIEPRPPVLREAPIVEAAPRLAPPSEGEDLVADYASLGLTLGRHPVALLRSRLARLGMVTAAQLRQMPHGKLARAAGIVIGRQRPDTASGVIFATLEDETGMINVVVWHGVAERQRRALLGSQLLAVHGVIEREGEVVHLVAGKLVDHSALLGRLVARSRDFH
jgi:error-prone DNA polymerase